MNIKILVGQRIRHLRAENGLSQEVLANLAVVDRTYMTGVENAKRNTSIEVYKR